MPRLESIIRFIIFASMLLSLIPPRLVFANAPESPHFQVKKPATTTEIQVPIPSSGVQTSSSSCDNFTSSLDGWTTVFSAGTGTLSNPSGLMRLSAPTSASDIIVKKSLSGYSGSILISAVFTSTSPTSLYFWVEYADSATHYIYGNGTTSSGVQTYTPSYVTPADKVPVALYFRAAVSPLFNGFQINVDQVCVAPISTPPSCDNFTSSLDGWTTVSSLGTGTVSNPPGMMRLSSSQSPPSGQYAAITVKKILAGHPGSITVTSIFTTFSGTTVQLWVEYADGSTDTIYSYGTTPSVPTTHVANFTTNPGKTAVALYFYAAASWLFPPWRVDIDQICVTALSSNPPPICYSFDNDLQGWAAHDLAGAISWLPSKMHLDAADHPHPGNSDYYVLPIFPDDIPNVYKITFSYDMSIPEVLFRLSSASVGPTVLCQQEDIGFSGSIECNFSPSIMVDGIDPASSIETTMFFDSYGTFTDWNGDLDNICVYSSTMGPSSQTLYLPLIMRDYTPPATFPVFIGTAIPIQPVVYQGEIFYSQTVQIPDQLPPGGHFYFSAQPDVVTQVLVDDELAVLLNGAEIFTYDFSSSGSPKSAIVEMPRATLEQLAGQTVTIQYRDVYGLVVYATQMWLIWTP